MAQSEGGPEQGLPDAGSVTRLMPALKAGDRAAWAELWRRYFQPLVRVAASRLVTPKGQPGPPEDVAQDALLKFVREMRRPDVEQRFPRLGSRDNVWRLLVCFAARGAHDANAKLLREWQVVCGESGLGEGGLEALAGSDPVPEVTLAITDLLGLLDDESLRAVAVLKLHGCTNLEIGRRLDRAQSTIELKLQLIRETWRAKGIDNGLC